MAWKAKDLPLCAAIFTLAFFLFHILQSGYLDLPFWQSAHAGGSAGMVLAAAQAVIFPVLILLFAKLSLATVRLPKVVLILSSVVTVSSVGVAFTYQGARRPGILVARLADDNFESETRVFRENLNKWLDTTSNVQAIRHPATFNNQERVLKFLNQEQKLAAVVWGSKRWINVTLPDTPDQSLWEAGVDTEYYPELALRYLTSVPIFGLSYQPRGVTSRFLSLLFSGLMPRGRLDPQSNAWKHAPFREMYLRAAGSLEALWSSNGHRAVPYWHLGNLHITEAFYHGGYEAGELRCAVQAYKKAIFYLKGRTDNPALLAAAHNNLGIAYFLGSVFEGNDDLQSAAKQHFKMAKRAVHFPDPFKLARRTVRFAQQNLKKLKLLRVVRIQNKDRRRQGRIERRQRLMSAKGKQAKKKKQKKKKHSAYVK